MLNSIKLKGRIALLLCPTVMLCSAVQCGCVIDDDQNVILTNATPEKIYCFSIWVDHADPGVEHQYWSDSNGYRYKIDSHVVIIDPNDSINHYGNFLYINMPSRGNRHPIMGLILLKQETFSRYNLKYIIENNIYDVRYILTYDELKKFDFRICYNGECSEETVTTLTHQGLWTIDK